MRLAISTTETLTDLKTDLVVANNNRKMLRSVCLLPIPLAFHCSMLNVLSDMVGELGGGEGVCGSVASYRVFRSSHWHYDNLQHFEDQNILNVPWLVTF